MFSKSYLDKLMVVSSITFSTALFVLSIVIVRKIIWISIPSTTQGKIDLRNESGRTMKVKVVGEVSEK